MTIASRLRAHLWRRLPLTLPEGWRFEGAMTVRPCRAVVDESLMVYGRVVTEVYAPLSPSPQLSLRAGSGTLLMAAAMTVMAGAVPDQPALLALASTLGFTPEKFLRGCPVLADTTLGGVPGRVVRDGRGRRAYFLGDAAVLAPLCGRIWDGGERPLTGDDLRHLPCPGGAHYALATAPMNGDTPGEATYLGSLLVEDAPCPAMLSALECLRREGMEILIRHGDAPPVLREGDLSVSAHPGNAPCLIPPAPDAEGLYTAVRAVSRRARQVDDQLRAAWQTVWMLLACSLLLCPCWQALLIALPLMALCCFGGGRLLQPARPRWRRLLAFVLPCLIAGLASAFLGMVVPGGGAAVRVFGMTGLCAMIAPSALCRRRAALALSAAAMALVPAMGLLLLQGILAAAFAGLSGTLCAVVYLALLPEA
ncbi:MAG: hypothetical protein ACI4ML_08780 [Aristaeellaceae bacterium]